MKNLAGLLPDPCTDQYYFSRGGTNGLRVAYVGIELSVSGSLAVYTSRLGSTVPRRHLGFEAFVGAHAMALRNRSLTACRYYTEKLRLGSSE